MEDTSEYKLYTLLPEEARVIDARRAAAEAEARERRIAIHLLETAAEFMKWKIQKGAGSSFSTFCDDFGYKGNDEGFARDIVYAKVSELIKVAFG